MVTILLTCALIVSITINIFFYKNFISSRDRIDYLSDSLSDKQIVIGTLRKYLKTLESEK
jgi:hypothetical protein